MKTWNSYRATKFAMLWAVGYWALPGALQANAPGYTYGIDIDNGLLSGTITTSCDQCVLNGGNITAWELVSTATPSATPAPFAIASTDPGAYVSFNLGFPSNLAANPTAITYDFGKDGEFFFANNNEFVLLGYSDIGASLSGFPGEISECSGSASGSGSGGVSCVGELFRTGPAAFASIKNVAAPELDSTSLAGALTLLLGSLAVLRGRRGSAGS